MFGLVLSFALPMRVRFARRWLSAIFVVRVVGVVGELRRSSLWKFSSTNLGSLYKGMQQDTFVNFKHLRKTKHTHNPVDDALGNAEALLQMKEMGLKISFK